MRQSELFTKTAKHSPRDEAAVNARLLMRAGFIEKVASGIYSFLPLGLRVLGKIAVIIREEMNAIGGQEVLLPVLHPREYWEQTGRWERFDALFKVKSREGGDYALGPTHEEVIVPFAKKHIASYQDLPAYLYQMQTKFRDEARAKSGLLRGREFLMKDLYSFHADERDLDRYYEKVEKAYRRIFKRLELRALLVEASGGTFSKFSHEFQVLLPSGEDIIFHCACGFAKNQEIFEGKEGDPCPRCGAPVLKAAGVEAGNIFKLGTAYSDPFGLIYRDRDGVEKKVLMGCYGIGVSRLMGVIAEVFHDEAGLRWPSGVAPFQVHLLSFAGGHDKKVAKFVENVYALWQNAGVEVLFDDRGVSPGEKFMDADLIGIPYRAVVSAKTGTKVEIKARSGTAPKLIAPSSITRTIV